MNDGHVDMDLPDWDLVDIDPNEPYATYAEKSLSDLIFELRAFRFTNPQGFDVLKLKPTIDELEGLADQLRDHVYGLGEVHRQKDRK